MSLQDAAESRATKRVRVTQQCSSVGATQWHPEANYAIKKTLKRNTSNAKDTMAFQYKHTYLFRVVLR